MSKARIVSWLFAPILLGCSKPSPGEGAHLETRGDRVYVVLADRAAEVPRGDLGHGGSRVPVAREAGGDRLAYPIPGGGARIVYAIGDGLFLGPTGASVTGGGRTDFSTAPSLEDALGAIFDNAVGRRKDAVRAVERAKGEDGLARMLVQADEVDDPAWREALDALPDAARAKVNAGLARTLDPSGPTVGLSRAVLLPALHERRASSLAARIRELTDPIREPRATAVLMRALASKDPELGGAVGCEVLHKEPMNVSPDDDRAAREVLFEAALLAVAAGSGDCDKLEAALEADPCVPSVRCAKDGASLDGHEPTSQDEPLCSEQELLRTIRHELERAPGSLMAAATGTRPELFAYAALKKRGALPEWFEKAHARRRYAVHQPKGPECDNALPPGTPCRCEEAILRDWACRHRDSDVLSVGVCKFSVDEKKKRISDVVATPPP